MEWLTQISQTPCINSMEAAQQRQSELTKPPGSLGDLECVAMRLAGLQGHCFPTLDKVHISIFAADHGVAAEGVSAFPQEVTAQMVHNFLNGGAAISVLAAELGAQLDIIDVGMVMPLEREHPRLISARVGAGTANSAQSAAMSGQQLEAALTVGKEAAERAAQQQAQLFIGGDMGIANTTTATALYCYLLNLPPQALTGAGTGLDEASIQHKVQVVRRILERHLSQSQTPLDALQRMGGFELAALTGAYLRAAQLGIPILVDGFICTAAALLACRLQPTVTDWLFLSHQSAEAGHSMAVEAMQQKPLLDLGLRLGEGSGAAIAVPLLRQACALHNRMATFSEAAVATQL